MPKMKFNMKITIAGLAIWVLLLGGCCVGCGGVVVGEGEEYDTLYRNSDAQRFVLLGRGDTVVLRVLNPWQGASGVSRDYSFTEPLERVVCMSSSHVALLDAVGGAEVVVGVSGKRFLTTRSVDGAVDVGYDNNINYEQLVALQPDVVFVYEVSGENSATVAKMEQLGLRVVYVADYLEQSPLGRAEWVVALGALVGRREQGERLFAQVRQGYDSLRRVVRGGGAYVNADSCTNANVNGAGGHKVMLNGPYKDVWYMPGDRSYMVQLLGDAGGEYMAAGVDDDVSRPVSVEVAYGMMRDADFWLNPGMGLSSLEAVVAANPRFGELDVVRRGAVYNNDARTTAAGGSDFWESGIVHPDVVLRDLVKILHPEVLPQHELYYYRQLK